MIKYRVIIKVGYCQAVYEFDNVEEAGNFAKTALTHATNCDDTEEKPCYVSMRVVNVDLEKERMEEDDE